MKNEGVKNEVQRLLVKSGLGEEAIIKKLKQAINSGLGEKATNSDSLRGIDMLAKMSKMYPNQKIEIDKKELKLSVEGKDSKELMGKLDRLLEQSKGMKETLTIEDGETIG